MRRWLLVLALGGASGFAACSDDPAEAPIPGIPTRPLGDAEAPVVPVSEAGTCPTSYTKTDDRCTFVSPFADPSFQGTPPNAWTLGAGAQIITSQNGPVDPGIARLRDASGARLPFGSVTQSIAMPGRAESEALAIEVVASASAQFAPGFFPVDVLVGGKTLSESFGGTSEAKTEDTAHTLHRCLGEAAYGGTIPVSFIAAAEGVPRLAVDKVTLVPDAACPLPGTVVNGDFEAAGGWTTSASNATIAPGLGKNGSRAARLTTSFTSAAGSIVGSLSVPSASVKAPALRMTTTGAGALRIDLDARTFAVLPGSGTLFGGDGDAGTPVEKRVCLPTWARGLVQNIRIALDSSFFLGSKSSTIDDIGIVDDPACADPTNGGFEKEAAPIAAWIPRPGGPVSTFRKTDGANSGAAFLQLASGTCAADNTTTSTAAMEQVFALPASTVATGGPAVTYFYRYTPGTGTSVRVLDPVDSGGPIFNPKVPFLPAAATWTKRTVCLSPRPAGTRVRVQITMTTAGACTPGTFDVDDVVLGNAPSCPLE